MTGDQLAAILAPFVAVGGGAAWLYTQLVSLREQIAAISERMRSLEREVDRLRSRHDYKDANHG